MRISVIAPNVWLNGIKIPESAITDLTIDTETAQRIINDLWNAGVRPNEGAENVQTCMWKEEGDEFESLGWETDCGNIFVLTEGTPKDKGMKYCCFCGKTLNAISYILI